MLNYDKPFVAFGKDLFSAQPDFAVQSTGSVYQLELGNQLLRFDGTTFGGLFDYRSDPSLSRPLDLDYGGMQDFLKAYLQQYKNRMVDNRLIVP